MCVRYERLGTVTRVSRRLQRDSFWLQEGWLPDLSDPATLGCLMALVREAWGDPYFYVVRGDVKIKGTDIFGWDFFGDFRGRSCKGMLYRSEAEALVAALEAAQ